MNGILTLLRAAARSTVLLLGGLAAASANTSAVPEEFDQLVEQVRTEFAIPGLAIAIVKEGRIQLAKGYGERKLGSGLAVNAKTLFPIASNTKAFTATALALLVDDDQVQWDEPVVTYLPDFALSDPYVTAHMTVRDLLAHNSGLPLGAGDLLWWPDTTYTLEEILSRLRFLPLERSFREAYAYDNVLYGVAGQLIETVSEKSWSEFLSQRILKPLNMRDTRVLRPGNAKRRNTAVPHAEIDGKLQVIEAYESAKIDAAGGLVVSARDMARWLQVQVARGRIDEEQRLFSERASQDLWSVVTPMPLRPAPCDIQPLATQFSGYALGFQNLDYRGQRLIRHGGGLPGYVSDVTLVPGLDLGIAVMTNQQVHAGISVLIHTVLDRLLDAQDRDWLPTLKACHDERMAEYLAAKKQVVNTREEGTPALPADKLIGRYRDRWYGDVEIRATDTKSLEVDFLPTPQLLGDMEHWHYNTYIVRWRDAPLPPNDVFITFDLNAAGTVVGARLKPVSPFTDFSYDFGHLDLRPIRD